MPVKEPPSTKSPGSSAMSNGASLLTSQATPLAGWLSTAAATPVSSMTLLRWHSTDTHRRSTSIGLIGRPPTIKAAFPALSAMLSRTQRGLPVSGSTRSLRPSPVPHAGRHDIVGSAQHVENGAVRPQQPTPQHEPQLAFQARLDEAAHRNFGTGAVEHVGHEGAVVGLLDVGLALHRARCQTDLAAFYR